MSYAPNPAPQYIDYDHNVAPLVGMDKIAVGDTLTTEIPTAMAAVLVAEGEAMALQDLSPYYVTWPALITTTGQDWTNLPSYTYSVIYYMMVSQAALKLIGNFIARNTDDVRVTLSYFQKFYQSEYNQLLNRVMELLPNGSYKYELTGLQPLNTGINRRPRCYARAGALGQRSYADEQITDPSINFSMLWPNGRFPG